MSKNRHTFSQSVIVTGASTGIGLATANWFFRRGYQVFATVRQDIDGQSLEESSQGKIIPVYMDVTEPSEIERGIKKVQENLGEHGLVGLVNNAGIIISGPVELLDLDDVRHQFEVNVIGQLAVTQACIPLLRKTQGRIVNVSSMAGFASSPMVGPYSASKHALEAFSDSLRMELRQWGIHVALIEPGVIETPIWDKGLGWADNKRKDLSKEQKQLYGDMIELVVQRVTKSRKRGISADEVAKAIYHAVTSPWPKTRYIVGNDARLRKLLTMLPEDIMDSIICRVVGLP